MVAGAFVAVTAARRKVRFVGFKNLRVRCGSPCSEALTWFCFFVFVSLFQTEVEPNHTLKGSISRRIRLFNHMAEHHDSAARPARREEIATASTDYSLAQDDDVGAARV